MAFWDKPSWWSDGSFTDLTRITSPNTTRGVDFVSPEKGYQLWLRWSPMRLGGGDYSVNGRYDQFWIIHGTEEYQLGVDNHAVARLSLPEIRQFYIPPGKFAFEMRLADGRVLNSQAPPTGVTCLRAPYTRHTADMSEDLKIAYSMHFWRGSSFSGLPDDLTRSYVDDYNTNQEAAAWNYYDPGFSGQLRENWGSPPDPEPPSEPPTPVDEGDPNDLGNLTIAPGNGGLYFTPSQGA